ncbi:hypothetical protein ACNFH8_23775 [Pseudomonas sp. NY15436]|uniref:hypothetical protein n=1 Tax=Pseudomonas sp. NY15436 TaxID=3400359 RepID=UPI003A84F056
MTEQQACTLCGAGGHTAAQCNWNKADGAHVPDAVFEAEFMTWWEKHGQYCRSGGGDYERTFAFQAWRHLYPQLMAAQAQPSPAPELEKQEPAVWLAYYFGGKRNGTVYGGPCATKEEMDRYILQVHRSDDSITLEGRPLYAAPVAQAAQVPAIQVCKLGIHGKAYDLPETKRAYTYAEQPDNLGASRLGIAVAATFASTAGDHIDRGLVLLRELKGNGFGVFELAAAPSQGGER